MSEQRRCKTCGTRYVLNRENFGSTPSGGFRHKCRTCMRKYVQHYDNASGDRKKAAIA